MIHMIFYRSTKGFLKELLIEKYSNTTRERYWFKLHDCSTENNALINPDYGMTFTTFLKNIHAWDVSLEGLINCYNLWNNYVAFCRSNNSILIDDFLYTLLNMPFTADKRIQMSIYNCNDELQTQNH